MPSDYPLDLSIGAEVVYAGETCVIQAPLSLTSFLLQKCASGAHVVARLQDLAPLGRVEQPSPVPTSDLVRLPSSAWAEAKRRAAVIHPLAALDVVPTERAQHAAEHLHVSPRTIYTLIKRYRASGGLLTSLVRRRSSGGRGKGRLPPPQEAVMAATIADLYLSRQRHRPSEVVQEVRRRCAVANIQAPSDKAIRTRINALPPDEQLTRRHGPKARHRLTPVQGAFPPVASPLDVVQMDHTHVDCLVVDEHTRQPIGRPFLTVGIDVYSRCITGFCVTLEARASAFSN